MRGRYPRRFGAWALAVLVVLALAGTIWAVWLGPPRVEPGATLVLRLEGEITEREPPNWEIAGFPRPWTVLRLRQTIRRAAADPQIAALILFPAGVDSGWATLAELHEALSVFRQSGKPLVAYLRTASARDYYLATAASRIVAPPGDLLNWKGLRVELHYLRGLLDRLGIRPEFESVGKYKDGADPLTRRTMSEPTRQVIEGILDRRFQQMLDAVARARQKSPDQVRRLVDEGPWLAGPATRAGLLDAAEFLDQAEGWLANKLGQPRLRKMEATRYQRAWRWTWPWQRRPKIAVLVLEGEVFGAAFRHPGAGFSLGPDTLRQWIEQIDKFRPAAVIVRINSPGGDALASDEMARQLRKLAARVPVVVSLGDVAASGGYGLAAAAGAIVARPETLTGSIGIFYGKLSLSGLYSQLGIHKELLTRGRFAAMDSEARSLAPDERQKLRSLLEELYQSFVEQVAQDRRKPVERIREVAEGRVWLGEEAEKAGLVDQLGGWERALHLARERAGLPAGVPLELRVVPSPPSWREILSSPAASWTAWTEAQRPRLLRMAGWVWLLR